MKTPDHISFARTFARFAAMLLLGALPLAAVEVHVGGLNWFGNRAAEQRLKLLLGEHPGPTLDASAIEDAALVLLSATNEDGYLAAKLTVEATLADGRTERYPLHGAENYLRRTDRFEDERGAGVFCRRRSAPGVGGRAGLFTRSVAKLARQLGRSAPPARLR